MTHACFERQAWTPRGRLVNFTRELALQFLKFTMADVSNVTVAAKKALRPLEERLQAMGLVFPKKLLDLLTKAKDMLGNQDASDKDMPSFIFREMFYFLARENEVGDGLSLTYPPEVVEAIRELYPGDICNYKPKSRKRQNLYKVPLEEFIEVYREGDLKSGEGHSWTRVPSEEEQSSVI